MFAGGTTYSKDLDVWSAVAKEALSILEDRQAQILQESGREIMIGEPKSKLDIETAPFRETFTGDVARRGKKYARLTGEALATAARSIPAAAKYAFGEAENKGK
jgi:hypothetical protein